MINKKRIKRDEGILALIMLLLFSTILIMEWVR
jgi:hypothetical protein